MSDYLKEQEDRHEQFMVQSSTVLHYELQEPLGQGGMGLVYKALDTRLNRTVALKFLPFLGADAQSREQLYFEARAAAQLDHPNIGTIYAIEETPEGQPFIAMALYEGLTLAHYLEQGKLGWREALELCLQMARGLGYAHDLTIIHRDIKPNNIVFAKDGLLKILDFGLAQFKQPSNATISDTVTGTIEYMAPEQLRGQIVDERADIWALAVILYEMLTGVHPFQAQADIAATMLAIISEEPLSLCEQLENLPIELEGIMVKALAKEPASRYDNFYDLIQELEALLTDYGGQPSLSSKAATSKRFMTQKKLPTLKNPLVGRLEELALTSSYLADPNCRMITLLGPGGIGKTRLSLELAHKHSEEFAQGCYFIALDSIEDASLIPSQIAEGLDLALEANRDALSQITKHIGDSELLLILDNYEHVMQGASLVSTLLESCSQLKILLSSRERLQLEEEWLVSVAGLPYPEEDLDLTEALRFAAVDLFKQRAQKLSADFELDQENLVGIVGICRLLQGMPLAIELAAAWTNLMPPQDILSEIQEDYDFLASRSRSIAERHRSLRAVFDYSWRLLSEQEQLALKRLAVFRGVIDYEAYKLIVKLPLSVLASLVDKSLLQVLSAKQVQSHSILLAYMQEKLAENQTEQQEAQARHAHYFLNLLIDEGQELRGAKQKRSMKRLSEVLDNIRLAWQWAHNNKALPLLEQASEALRFYFHQKGLIQEGLKLFGNAIEQFDSEDKAQAATLAVLKIKEAYFYISSGHYDQAKLSVKQGMRLLDASKQSIIALSGLNALATILSHQGDYEKAKEVLLRAYRFAKKHKQESTRMIGIILDNLGNIEQEFGDVQKAQRYFQKSLELSRVTSNLSQIAYTLNNLASLALSRQEPAVALPFLEEGQSLAKDLGMTRLVPFFLCNLAIASYKLANYQKAQAASEEALVYVKASGERWLEAIILAQLGDSYSGQNDFVKAQQVLQEALLIAHSIKDMPSIMHILSKWATLFLKQEKYLEAFQAATMVKNHPASSKEDKLFALTFLDNLAAPALRFKDVPQLSLDDLVLKILKPQPLPK